MTTSDERELDSWIAEHVMGYRWMWFSQLDDPECGKRCIAPTFFRECVKEVPRHPGVEFPLASNGIWDKRLPHYTTDPAAAFEVLKKCMEHYGDRGGTLRLHFNGQSGFGISDDANRYFVFEAPLETAICHFARGLFSKSLHQIQNPSTRNAGRGVDFMNATTREYLKSFIEQVVLLAAGAAETVGTERVRKVVESASQLQDQLDKDETII